MALHGSASGSTGVGSGTVTSVSVTTAAGISGSVVNPTTTPAITVTIGAAAVTRAMMANTAAATVLGSTAAGAVAELTAAQARTVLGLATVASSGLASDLTGTLAAAQLPAMTGDVTANAGTAASTIATNIVTYAKFQQVAASSLVGNPTGSTANAQGITLGGGLFLSGTVLYGPVEHPGYVSGNWYSPIPGTAIGAGAALASGSIRLLPFTISKPITIAQLGARVTTLSAAGNFQLAIYANNATTGKATGTALCSTASMSTGSTGTVTAVASATLAAGTYWMAINQDNSTAVYITIALGSTTPGYLVGSTAISDLTANSTTSNGTMVVAQAFGTWPDLTSATFASNVASNANALVFLKAA